MVNVSIDLLNINLSIMLRLKDIEEFKEYLSSGRWAEDFDFRTQDGQDEMLDLVEALFDLCDTADKVLTKKLYQRMSGTDLGQSKSSELK